MNLNCLTMCALNAAITTAEKKLKLLDDSEFLGGYFPTHFLCRERLS